VFLGKYDFEGDPDDLLAAYERMMQAVPEGNITLHACVSHDTGITIYDTCPSAEVFAAFSSSPELHLAMHQAGLPAPRVTPLGEVRVARFGAQHFA
jgi:hypothetical protein